MVKAIKKKIENYKYIFRRYRDWKVAGTVADILF